MGNSPTTDHVDAPERTRVNLAQLERDIAAVLVAHGLTDLDTVSVSAYEITQGDAYAGVTVSAYAYERPAHLPPASECARTEDTGFAKAIEVLERAEAAA